MIQKYFSGHKENADVPGEILLNQKITFMAKIKIKTKVRPGWAKFCGWWLRKMGWKSVGGPMKEPKAIVLGVPHTTVWDFLVSYLFYTQFGKVAHIMVKKSFSSGPWDPSSGPAVPFLPIFPVRPPR